MPANTEWQEATLATMIDVKHGFAFPGENIRDEPPGDILVTPGNFAIGGGFKSDKFKYFDGEVPDDYVLCEGDLIITMTDLSKQGDTLGYPALVPKAHGPRFLHNQRLGKVHIKRGAELDGRFLFYFLRTAEYRHEVLAGATGTTVKHTSPGRILAYRAAFPPLSEQREIAAVLSSLDDKIELFRKQHEILEQIAQALFNEWFVQFNFPNQNQKPYRISGGKMVGGELGEVPNGWGAGIVKDLIEILSGFAFKSSNFVDTGKYKLATIKNVQDGFFVEQTTDCLSELPAKMPPYCILKTGDALLSLTGNVGRVCYVVGEDYLLNQRVAKIEAKNKRDSAFAYFFFRQPHIIPTLGQIASGTAQKNLSPIETSKLKMIVPPRAILDAFSEIAGPMQAKMHESSLQIQHLAKIRDLLLPKLMSGEIQVC
jgi:type I restriction enzyme, S subunit